MVFVSFPTLDHSIFLQLTQTSNEAEVGKAAQSSSIPRSTIFLTTKLGHADKISERLNESVALMDPTTEGYVDLFLIHAPTAGPEKRKEQWAQMEKLVRDGKAKSIGVSN
jgi:diketogulonate reductase-like aldo/keto reductase